MTKPAEAAAVFAFADDVALALVEAVGVLVEEAFEEAVEDAVEELFVGVLELAAELEPTAATGGAAFAVIVEVEVVVILCTA